MNMIPGNSSPLGMLCGNFWSYGCICLIVPFVYWKSRCIFEVDENHFALVETETKRGKITRIYGPGYHVLDYFNKLYNIYSFD